MIPFLARSQEILPQFLLGLLFTNDSASLLLSNFQVRCYEGTQPDLLVSVQFFDSGIDTAVDLFCLHDQFSSKIKAGVLAFDLFCFFLTKKLEIGLKYGAFMTPISFFLLFDCLKVIGHSVKALSKHFFRL